MQNRLQKKDTKEHTQGITIIRTTQNTTKGTHTQEKTKETYKQEKPE